MDTPGPPCNQTSPDLRPSHAGVTGPRTRGKSFAKAPARRPIVAKCQKNFKLHASPATICKFQSTGTQTKKMKFIIHYFMCCFFFHKFSHTYNFAITTALQICLYSFLIFAHIKFSRNVAKPGANNAPGYK